MKKILIMGAGKVGQDYAAHLADTNVDVTLLCRPRQRDELLSRGVNFLTRSNDLRSTSFHASKIISSIEQVADESFDAAIACFRSEQRGDVAPLLAKLKEAPHVVAFSFPVWPRSDLSFLPSSSAKVFMVPRIFAFRGPLDPSATRIECIDPGGRALVEAFFKTKLRMTHVERLRETFSRNLVLGLPAIRALDAHAFRARAFANDRSAVEEVLDAQESLVRRLPVNARPFIPPRFLRRRILRNLDTLFAIGRRDVVESHVRAIAEQARTLLEEFETLYDAS